MLAPHCAGADAFERRMAGINHGLMQRIQKALNVHGLIEISRIFHHDVRHEFLLEAGFSCRR
jgi:hypothetical protein